MSAGHPEAGDYPLGRLQDEAFFVAERQRQEAATSAVLLHAAAAAVLAEDGHQHFKKTLASLESED